LAGEIAPIVWDDKLFSPVFPVPPVFMDAEDAGKRCMAFSFVFCQEPAGTLDIRRKSV